MVEHDIEPDVPILLNLVNDIVEATCELEDVPAGKEIRQKLKFLFFCIISVVESRCKTVTRHIHRAIQQIVLEVSSVFLHV